MELQELPVAAKATALKVLMRLYCVTLEGEESQDISQKHPAWNHRLHGPPSPLPVPSATCSTPKEGTEQPTRGLKQVPSHPAKPVSHVKELPQEFRDTEPFNPEQESCQPEPDTS